MDKLSEAVKLARENGMSYAEYQRMESLGKARIANGRMIFDNRRAMDERNRGNTQREP